MPWPRQGAANVAAAVAAATPKIATARNLPSINSRSRPFFYKTYILLLADMRDGKRKREKERNKAKATRQSSRQLEGIDKTVTGATVVAIQIPSTGIFAKGGYKGRSSAASTTSSSSSSSSLPPTLGPDVTTHTDNKEAANHPQWGRKINLNKKMNGVSRFI